MCKDCAARRKMALAALYNAKVAEATKHLMVGAAEAVGAKEKTGAKELEEMPAKRTVSKRPRGQIKRGLK